MNRLLLSSDRIDIIRDMTRFIQTIPDWEIVCTQETEQMWATFREQVPALILLDINLGGTSRQDRWRALPIKPIIIFFGIGDLTDKHVEAVKKYNVFDYLSLPLNLDRIMFAIRIANKDIPTPPGIAQSKAPGDSHEKTT